MKKAVYLEETERAVRASVERLKTAEERRVGAFDREVRQAVECLLSKLLVEYGRGENQ